MLRGLVDVCNAFAMCSSVAWLEGLEPEFCLFYARCTVDGVDIYIPNLEQDLQLLMQLLPFRCDSNRLDSP